MTASHSSPVKADNEKNRAIPKNINRILYTAFTLIGILYWIFGTDKSNGIAQLGIALIFDPFNPRQPFGQRPTYQKVWLFGHVAVVLAGFAWEIFK